MVGRGEQHEQQFLAAPSDDRMVAGEIVEDVGDADDGDVAGLMAAHVVDELEVVDIAQGEHDVRFAAHAFDLLLQVVG